MYKRGTHKLLDDSICAAGLFLGLSSYIKWVPVGVDPAVLSAGVGIAGLAVRVLVARIPQLTPRSVILLGSLMLVIALGVSSSVFSLSENYIWRKVSQTILLFLAVLFVSFGRDPVRLAVRALRISSLAAAGVLGFLLVRDGSLSTYVAAAASPSALVPDYLSISALLGAGVLVRLQSHWLKFISFMVAGVFIMLLLGGRGPVIFLVLALLVAMSLEGVRRRMIGVIAVATLLLSALVSDQVGIVHRDEGFFARMAVLAGGDSTVARLEHLEIVRGAIEESPILGLGYGAYGVYAEGSDGRLYPHNFALELWVELGIPGLFLGGTLIALIARGVWLAVRLRALPNPVQARALGLALFYLALEAMKSSSLVDLRLLFIILAALAASSILPATAESSRRKFGPSA